MRNLFLALALLALPESQAFAADPFAVVELFASEGCSSCPPADDLIRKITQKTEGSLLVNEKKKQVFTLTFEVDYWDYLGWKDPFSRPEFTQRQQQYAQIFNAKSIYTPQMIVNGQKAFVGSDESKAREAIDHFLKIPNSVHIDLRSQINKQGQLKIYYQLNELPQESVLNFALVGRNVEIPVKAGENAGRLLQHTNIVYEFKTINLTNAQGEVEFLSTSNMNILPSIIAYIQDKNTMKILAATQIDS